MGAKKSHKSFSRYDIMKEIKVSELLIICQRIIQDDPFATVTIRQCQGTDFPPFITIESDEFREEQDNKGEFPRLLL